MRAVILCAGPSLAGVAALPKHDVLIAVNFALEHDLAKGADWWVGLDLWNFALPKNKPKHGMVTSSAAINEGQAIFIPYPMFDFRKHPKSRATATSLPAALWWAAHLGAKTVELVGCDLSGMDDWRGVVDNHGRSPDRWKLERKECLKAAVHGEFILKGLPCRE